MGCLERRLNFKVEKIMKKKLLVLATFILTIGQIWGQTDIGNTTDFTSLVLVENVYTGEPINAVISLTEKATNTSLVRGTDYVVTYTLNGNPVTTIQNAGNYAITLAGIGSYTGQRVLNATINQAGLSNVVVSGVNTSYFYTGSQITPAVSVTLNGVSISANEYTIAYGENLNVSTGGTITLSPVANGNFTGTNLTGFTIVPVDISTATTAISLNPTSYTYTGSVIVPSIQAVTVNGTTITTADYTVNDAPAGTNTNVGNATLTVTGKGNYKGSASQSFTITAADISTAAITLAPTSYEYTGTPITPTISSVVVGGRSLTANTDYTVNIPADGTNTDVGEGTVGISGINNYTNTASQTFTITRKTLTEDMFISIATKTYTGSAITLEAADISTSYNSKSLVLDTDYSISGYQNNTEAGEASVTFTGKGNFTGDVTVNFEIHEEPLTADMFTIADKTFTGSAIQLMAADITAKDAQQTTLVLDTDFEIVSYANNTDAGTATVTFQGKGDYSGTVPVSFTINPVSLSATMFTISNKTYTGSAVELIASDITATFNSNPLVLGTDFTLGTYTNNTASGTATVTISGKGNYVGDVIASFTIGGTPLSAAMFTIANKTYTGSAIQLADVDITANNNGTAMTLGTDYTIGSYTDNVNAGTATVIINGAGNYSGNATVNFTIAPATLTAEMFTTIAGKSYTGAVVSLTSGDITASFNSKSLVLGTDYTIGFYNNNINAGTATVVFNGTGNFTGSTSPVNFTINPVPLTAGMITIPKQYYTGQTQKPLPTVKLGNIILLSSNYTVSYPDTENGAYVQPGNYNVKVDAVSNGNLTGSATIKFEIIEAPEVYHKVTIPAVEGVTTDPPAGTYDVTEGNYFTFYLTIDPVTDGLRAGIEPTEDLIVKVNGTEMYPYDLGDGRYRMTIEDIEEDIVVEIILKGEPPVSNQEVPAESVKVYGSVGTLHIESTEAAMVSVFNMNGQLKYRQKINNTNVTISVPRGIYLVKIDNQVFKALVK